MKPVDAAKALLIVMALSAAAMAQDTGADDAPAGPATPARPVDPAQAEKPRDVEAELDALAEEVEIPATLVIGTRDAARTLPGSGHVVESKEMRRNADGDPVRILRRLPGVIARQEDGYGNFPNLSLRGVDTTRSAKVTIMEDGVLSAPAPYSAPSAYYTPNAERMSGIEVLKGSSQVRHGPHTTGGVVNFLSTEIPDELTVFARGLVGEDADHRFHGWVGGTFDTDWGDLGVLVEGFWRTTDGFKSINAAPGYAGSGRTGFRRDEPMVKVSFSPKSSLEQTFEFKWGSTDFSFDEGYLGLTETDFDRDPYQRYAASRFDEMNSEQEHTHLRWMVKPVKDLSVTATWYYTRFQRDWFKLNDVTNSGGTRVSLSNAIAAGGDHLDVLRGAADGSFRVRHNNRSYWSKGIDTVTRYRIEGKSVTHNAEVGIRHHRDRVRRNQWDVTYTQTAADGIIGSAAGAPGSAGDRRQETTALATYLQDRVEMGDVTVTGGVRREHLRQHHQDFAAAGTNGFEDMTIWAGGLGATWELDDDWVLFSGVNQGFSPPSPRAAVKDGIKEERSLGMELGARYRDRERAFEADLTVFRTNFEDLIVINNIGGSGSGATENAGDVVSQGVEFGLRYDPGIHREWSVDNPWFVAATWTQARLDGDSNSSDPESIFSGGKDGNDVPYIPELSFTAGTGIEGDDAGVFVTATWVDETYSTASNTSKQLTPAGVPDARFGKIDRIFVIDLHAHVNLSENATLMAGVHNLLDREFIVSRHPHGPRPGRPRFAWVGLELLF